MLSKFTHVVTNGGIFLSLRLYDSLLCMGECVYHIFFINSSIDGYLSCFHILANMNNAATYRIIKISLEDSHFISPRYIPRVRLLDHMEVLFFIFWGTSIPVLIVAIPIYINTNSVKRFLSSTSSSTFIIYCLFENSHPDRCEVIYHCDFALHSPDN